MVVESRTEADPRRRGARWRCRCACGTTLTVRGDSLSSGNTTSCGCAKRELAAEVGRANRTHGRTGSPEYAAWRGAWTRCTNPRRKDWADYGGRGISDCERWRDFAAFLSDMGPRPEGGSIERIDTDGGYTPKNCRWATAREQARNRRTSRVVEIGGRRATLAEWAERSGISEDVLWARLHTLRWPAERLLEPARKRKRKAA